jgi:hypothetical protein
MGSGFAITLIRADIVQENVTDPKDGLNLGVLAFVRGDG